MNKWLRHGLVAGTVLIAIGGGAVIAGNELARSKMDRRIDVPPRAVALKDDAASIQRGRYLYASRGCVECHGAEGGGRTFMDDGKGFVIAGPSIAPGGVTAAYRAADWDRAIRHGVKPDGRPAIVMPSEDYNGLTDDDLAALVAHIRQLPPAPARAAIIEFPLPVRVLYGWGAITDAAAKIDHLRAPSAPVPEGVSLAHGKYVANMCFGCHGVTLTGGKIPGGPPDWPAAANLTPGEGSAMVRYPDADSFAAMFKTGRRPDGSTMKVMPFEALAEMSDTDVRALHLYLTSLAPKPTGARP